MNDADVKKIVAETVSETLLKLGIDASDPIELQKDMQHLRQWRESIASVKRQSIITAVGVITLGALGLLWTAVKGPGG